MSLSTRSYSGKIVLLKSGNVEMTIFPRKVVCMEIDRGGDTFINVIDSIDIIKGDVYVTGKNINDLDGASLYMRVKEVFEYGTMKIILVERIYEVPHEDKRR